MVSFCQIKSLFVAFLLCAYFPENFAQLETTTEPEVTIPQGTLLGKTLTTRYGRDFSAFQGIPYGQPPIGNLRWANPVAAVGWNGTLNATDDSVVCAQFMMNSVLGVEDCLYVNVYTPQLPQTTDTSLLPVMVFIHGGAFKTGSKSADMVGAEFLLDKDVVYVALNYRLGPLGFLSTGDEVASGNWGLKDQLLALEWVQDNIQYFGGDADQVTLFGESAGAGCVHLLTLTDSTIGLFHRYITQSGSALSKWAHRPRAAYASRAFELGEFVGCSNDTTDSLITCLRTVDVSNIIATESQFMVWEFLPDIIWGPTDEPDIEGAILTDTPTNLFAAGAVRDLPWIAGIDRDEGLLHTASLYADETMFYDFMENIDTLLPIMLFWTYESDGGAAWVDAVKSFYFNNDFTSDASVLLASLTAVISDSHFFYPTRSGLQQQLALAQNPQYFYTFNYLGTYSASWLYSGSAVNRGVAHADDLIYLFPSEPIFSSFNKTMSETDYEMVDTLVELWTSFAIDGTPTASALNNAAWDPYSTADNYLRIGNSSDTALEIQYSFFEERMQFWASIYATTDNTAAETETAALGSDTITLSSNLISVLLAACSKFFL